MRYTEVSDLSPEMVEVLSVLGVTPEQYLAKVNSRYKKTLNTKEAAKLLHTTDVDVQYKLRNGDVDWGFAVPIRGGRYKYTIWKDKVEAIAKKYDALILNI